MRSRPLSEREEQYLLTSSRSSATHYFNLDESATSGMSSFNQTGLMFMSQDQLQSIAESLSKFQSSEVCLFVVIVVVIDLWVLLLLCACHSNH